MVTATEPTYDERLITAHGFTHEELRDSYCWQASSMVHLHVSAYRFDRNSFSVQIASVHGMVKILFIRPFEHIFYIAGRTHNRQISRVKDVYKPAYAVNITGWICQIMSIGL